MSEPASQTKHKPGKRYPFKRPLKVKARRFPLDTGAIEECTFESGRYLYQSKDGYGFEGSPTERPEETYMFVLPSLEEVETKPL